MLGLKLTRRDACLSSLEIKCVSNSLLPHDRAQSTPEFKINKTILWKNDPSRVTSKTPLTLPRNMFLGMVQGRLTGVYIPGLAGIWGSPLFSTITCACR